MIHRSLLTLIASASLVASPAVFADDPIKDVVDAEVPSLKDGTRIPAADLEAAILAACKKWRFEVLDVSPGVVTARWVHGRHTFDVTIPYTDTLYSIRYKDSKAMDYDPVKKRIDDSYNEYVAGLSEHIDGQFERALDKIKKEQKAARKAAAAK